MDWGQTRKSNLLMVASRRTGRSHSLACMGGVWVVALISQLHSPGLGCSLSRTLALTSGSVHNLSFPV